MPPAKGGAKRQKVDGKQLGVSPPISTVGPTDTDLRASAALRTALGALGADDSGGAERYTRCLADLESLVVRWVCAVGLSQGLSDEQASTAGGRLLPLGSCALLGAPMRHADIDAVAVVPYFVPRAVRCRTSSTPHVCFVVASRTNSSARPLRGAPGRADGGGRTPWQLRVAPRRISIPA